MSLALLVSLPTTQSAKRGAKSAMISEHLAGGDCLNVGCVPSKALIRAAKAIMEVKRCAEFGVVLPEGEIKVDFAKIMQRLREKRTHISPADGHPAGVVAGSHVFQGRGKFTGPNTIQVGDKVLTFKKAVVATGGRPGVPNVPGLKESPYTTNEFLFNLEVLPPRMIILGAGVIALEMAQCFAAFGSHVTVLQRSTTLFASKQGDPEAAQILQEELEKGGVHFMSGSTKEVVTLRERTDDPKELPLLKLTIETDAGNEELECECLLVATGRVANVENLGLEEAGVEYDLGKGIKCNDLAQSVSNPNVYGVGDCVADVPVSKDAFVSYPSCQSLHRCQRVSVDYSLLNGPMPRNQYDVMHVLTCIRFAFDYKETHPPKWRDGEIGGSKQSLW
jgi:pyruvate/2-oxoglutarate dehydrogenase complex dihydrolipoamide dehydrogenase (E3) component